MNLDKVNHPSHYGGESNTYEVIKIIEAYDLDFSTGNIIKYTLRAGKKGGEEELSDLKKAQWYLNRKINNLENK